MKKTALIALLIPFLLAGCGKTETVSTDTAVTDTISPDETEATDSTPEADSGPNAPPTDTDGSVEQSEE